MKFTEGKTSVDCFRNSFRIAGTWNFLLMTCILQTEKKLVVQIFDRILKKFAVVGKTLEKLFQQSGCGILINIRQCLRGPWNIFRIPQSVPSENFRHESGSGGKAESVKKKIHHILKLLFEIDAGNMVRIQKILELLKQISHGWRGSFQK